jgi:hypothetical protein
MVTTPPPLGRLEDERFEPPCRGLAHAPQQVLVGAWDRRAVVPEPLLDDLRGLARPG